VLTPERLRCGNLQSWWTQQGEGTKEKGRKAGWPFHLIEKERKEKEFGPHVLTFLSAFKRGGKREGGKEGGKNGPQIS